MSKKGINVGSAVLVTGEGTFAAKDALKAVGGGVWCKPLTGWVFHGSKRQAVLDAVKGIDGIEMSADDVAPMAEEIKAEPSVGAEAHLTIEPYKKSVVVKGDTKEVICPSHSLPLPLPLPLLGNKPPTLKTHLT